MRTGSTTVGVLGIERDAPGDAPGPLLTPDERRLLDALADQVAVAIERISLARGLAETRVLAETERMRAALLTSISHDLRTPLASILGTASSLRSYADRYSASRPSSVPLIDSRHTSRAVLTSSTITSQPARIASTNAESTRRTSPPRSPAGTKS